MDTIHQNMCASLTGEFMSFLILFERNHEGLRHMSRVAWPGLFNISWHLGGSFCLKCMQRLQKAPC